MVRKAIQKIVFIGAGNLAANFALALFQKGYNIFQIYNRSQNTGKSLSEKVGARYTDDLRKLSKNADLYIIAVNDNSLKIIIEQIQVGNKLIVHTSGSMKMNILKNASKNFGVLYSPQTFSKEHPSNFRGVPVCIEANLQENESLLRDLALSLTRNVHIVNSEKRRMIHLAAIFANNFTNFMYVIAEDLLEKEGLDFKILQPIIRQTAANARHKRIFHFQTGPAIREDTAVMKNHLTLLKKHPGYQQVYGLISKMIIQLKNK